MVDLFSRRIVGWSMSATMTAQLVTDALMMVILRGENPTPCCITRIRAANIRVSTSSRLIVDNGVACSMSRMSRSDDVWGNAAMERFFSSLKSERTARKTCRTQDQAKVDVSDYIERLYNPKRRHSTLGYLSPMGFEKQVLLA